MQRRTTLFFPSELKREIKMAAAELDLPMTKIVEYSVRLLFGITVTDENVREDVERLKLYGQRRSNSIARYGTGRESEPRTGNSATSEHAERSG